jgi:hypothetical protein
MFSSRALLQAVSDATGRNLSQTQCQNPAKKGEIFTHPILAEAVSMIGFAACYSAPLFWKKGASLEAL